MADHFDVVVVGAGPHGLCATHTFLSLDPCLNVLIIDDKSSVGGVWAKEQLYPGLRANNLQGWFEFSDLPIEEVDLGPHTVTRRGLLTGESLNLYFEKYAEKFGLLDKVRLRTKVVDAVCTDSEEDSSWTLFLETIREDGSKINLGITCKKLVVATGAASIPLIPSFPGSDSFQRPIIHSAELGSTSPKLLTDPSVNHVTILGGSRSAHDAVYMFASIGKRVTWLIRKTGRVSPMALSHTKMGPWSIWLEDLLMSRPLSWFGAAPWSDGDGFGWIRWLLHGTTVGRFITRGYWAGLSAQSLAESGINRTEKTKTLLPAGSMMWYGTEANSLTYDDDFYDVVNRENVDIVREDIARLDEGRIVLADKREVETDALLCATGWKFGPAFPMGPREKQLPWGVPVETQLDNMYPPLEDKVDAELVARFPELKLRPQVKELQPGLTAWRLWRFIAPPSQVCSKRSLVFFNTLTAYQSTLRCEITSLWAYAYLFDQLNVQPESEERVRYEATLWSRFGFWSRPFGMQGKTAGFFMDAMPYFDLLLRDLGLRSWRRGWGLLGEVFGGWYEWRNYRGLVEEWKTLQQAKHKKAV